MIPFFFEVKVAEEVEGEKCYGQLDKGVRAEDTVFSSSSSSSG